MNHRFVYLGLGLAVLVGGFALVYRPAPSGQPLLPQKTIQMPGGPLIVEIADSKEELTAGLSDRPNLAQNQGMLFLFSEPQIQPFWMYRMRFPLDILYLRGGVIQEIFPQVPPPRAGETPKTVTPTLPADAVLEVYGGESARFGWKVGDQLFAPEAVR